jgi:hypothetical protein
MTAAGVALLKAEKLQLGLDLIEETLAHGDVWDGEFSTDGRVRVMRARAGWVLGWVFCARLSIEAQGE